MNAAGTCEQRFGPAGMRLVDPVWRPGVQPRLGPLRCVDVRVLASFAQSVVGIGRDASLRVAVENDGNETATGVVLRVALARGTVGTNNSDRILGSPRRDTICAREGFDTVRAGAGDDWIDAGPGYDTVTGGRGRDTVLGGGERDTIIVRDGFRDDVSCGGQRDRVVADRLDRVSKDCERVSRRR
jgi:Ca2+-binding RTX toxin-like protein